MLQQRISWSNPRVLGALLLVFLCGAGAGAMSLRLLRSARTGPTITALKTDNKGTVLARFQKDLDLTPQQAEKFEIILDDYMKYISDLQEQMDEVRKHGKSQLMKVLNEDQRRRFEKNLDDIQAKGR
ncbi:MAG: hypothetical protein NTV70_20285 [Acidobacteria bacterium]|nr:hypothetical protein [Acidobacteriota bacterium]